MAITQTFTLSDSAWSDISTTLGVAAFITNRSENYIIYREDESVPSNDLLEGHILKPKGQINYQVTGSAVIYARSLDGITELIGTEGTLS